jgi:capsular polysaccharide biosynthesis protein
MDSTTVSSPWEYSENKKDAEIVLRLPPSKPQKIVLPRVYGADNLPLADSGFPNVMRYPEPAVSRLRNVVILPNHVLVDGDTNELLSQTFYRNRLHHHGGVKLLDDGRYRSKYDIAKMPILKFDQPIYHADTDHPEVYGHVLLEVLSALWARDTLGYRGLKVATSIKLSAGYLGMLNALGVEEKDILQVRGPVVSEEVFIPTNIIQRRRYMDPLCRDIYKRLASELARKSTLSPVDRIYISRSKVSGRKLLNELAVEDLFAQHGFSIIHPQELSIYDQAKLFSEAKFIAGSGGSAMHNTLFSNEKSKVLIVSSVGWLVVADTLICQEESQLGYVFGYPERPPVDTHRTQADWSVDLAAVRKGIKEHFLL